MADSAEHRTVLRRETHDINAALAALVDRLDAVDDDAASAVRRARSALFEAWTILCVPPDDHDDH